MLQRTPLFAAHQELGARLVEFGGWEMPVQYQSIVEEHQAVRQTAGLFDISHMGEVRLVGPEACAFLNSLLTNDVRRLAVGQGQYTLMLNERGGTVDDLYVFRTRPEEYLLVVNASRIDADVAWLRNQWASRGLPPAGLCNLSDDLGAVAVQGPKVREFIEQTMPGAAVGGASVARVTALQKNEIAAFTCSPGETIVWVSRTGYTGEDGFEVVAPAATIEALWRRLLEAGRPYGLRPAGLGARDTLRTEMCYPLYGHELDEQTGPIEAGLGFFVCFDKGEFNGRPVLCEQKQHGVARKCVAFKMAGRSAPPRPQYAIWSTGAASERIGTVVSGTQSPSLGIGVGMGYLRGAFSSPGTEIEIDIRGRRAPAVVVRKPIYQRTVQPVGALPLGLASSR